MLLTLDKILNTKIFQQAEVLTAKTVLSERLVSGITVTETPVQNFVHPDELVLTTGIGCEDTDSFLSFVKEIHQSKAAGLIIATGHYITHIPDPVSLFAENHHLPMITIPWGIRFADVIQEVLEKINHWRQWRLQKSEEIQKQMLTLLLHGGSLSDVAKIIYEKINIPFLIVDQQGIIKGSSPNAVETEQIWKKYLHSSSQPLSSIQQSTYTKILPFYFDDKTLAKFQIQGIQQCEGYLLFSSTNDQNLEHLWNEDHQFLLEQSIDFLSLWFQKHHLSHQQEDFVWQLAHKPYDQLQNKSLYYNLQLPYLCLLAQAENLTEIYYKQKEKMTSFAHWQQKFGIQFRQTIANLAQKKHIQTMIGFQDNQWIIYLESRLDEHPQSIHLFLDQCESEIKKWTPSLILSWGIGEQQVGVQLFQAAYTDAAQALKAGRQLKGIGYRYSSHHTHIYQLLHEIGNNPEIRAMAHSSIATLIEYSEKNGLDLIQTLNAYIENLGNVSQTARNMHLHRQSLLYRLQKIERLTGRSLLNPDDLFLLNLSIRLFATGILKY